MAEKAGDARKRRATIGKKRAAKGPVLHPVEVELPSRRRSRVSLPLLRSKQPDTIALDNAKIFEIIPFP